MHSIARQKRTVSLSFSCTGEFVTSIRRPHHSCCKRKGLSGTHRVEPDVHVMHTLAGDKV